MQPKVTVLVCTWNRAASLERTLEGLDRQTLSAAEFEVVVVDNNSTDDTEAVVKRHQADAPYELRYMFEREPGKTFALNAGLGAARAPVVACTDHDCIPDPKWLEMLLKAFSCSGASLVGGPAVSVFPEEVLRDNRRAFIGSRFLGTFAPYQMPTEVTKENLPLGMNLAFRREVLDKIGGFNTSLGPRPGLHLGREETDFVLRAIRSGFTVLYTPHASVNHMLEPERMTLPAILAQAYQSGMGTYWERYSAWAGSSIVKKSLLICQFLLEAAYAWGRYCFWLPNFEKRTVARFRAAAHAGKIRAAFKVQSEK